MWSARSLKKGAETSPVTLIRAPPGTPVNNISRSAGRLAARQRESRPNVADLEQWMRTERARLSRRHSEIARAIDYMPMRWTAFLDGRRI
jgi:hypothetical protein